MTTVAATRTRSQAVQAPLLPVLLKQFSAELNTIFFEREEAIDVVLTTMLAGENGFMEGEPGTGKSDMLETICKGIVSGKYARFLMDPFMGKEDVFGAHDIAKYLAGGGWTRDTTDTAVDAHMILWDEVGRTPGGILASMLTIMNERQYKPNGHWIDVPMISSWGASNSWIFDVLPAMADRFLVNISLEYLKEDANILKLWDRTCDGTSTQLSTQIPLELLQDAIAHEVPRVKVPTGVRTAVLDLKNDLRTEQIVLSDRRWNKVWGLVKASAYLAGKTVADEDDLSILQHALFNHPDQRGLVRSKVLALQSPISRAVMELGGQIDSIAAEVDKRRKDSLGERAGYGAQAQHDLGVISGKLAGYVEQAHRDGRSPAALDVVKGQIKALHNKILVDCLNVPADRIKA